MSKTRREKAIDDHKGINTAFQEQFPSLIKALKRRKENSYKKYDLLARLSTFKDDKELLLLNIEEGANSLFLLIYKTIEYFTRTSGNFTQHFIENKNKVKSFEELYTLIYAYEKYENSESHILKNEMLNLLYGINHNWLKIKNSKIGNVVGYSLLQQCEKAKPRGAEYHFFHQGDKEKKKNPRQQIEQFFTQVLVYTLNMVSEFKTRYIYNLNERHSDVKLSSECCVTGEISKDREQPDIILKDKNQTVVIENKVSANFELWQLLRYVAMEEQPIVFSLTHNNIDNEIDNIKDVFENPKKEKLEAIPHKKEVKDYIPILLNAENLSQQWGGHLFWDNKMAQKSKCKSRFQANSIEEIVSQSIKSDISEADET